jgi:hypothetical protein
MPHISQKQQKNKSPLPRRLIRSGPKQCGRSSVRPLLPPRARRAVTPCPSPIAAAPRALASCSAHLCPDTRVASSLAVRLSPIAVGCAADPRHGPWGTRAVAPQVFLGRANGTPRVWAVLVVLARCHSPLDPTPTTGIGWPRFPLPYVANVCFKCFRCFRGMSQFVIYGCYKSRSGCCTYCIFLQVFSVVCCKHFEKIFHQFSYVCCHIKCSI